MFVCICKGIRESEVRQLVAGRCVEPELVLEVLGLDDPGVCGRCPREISAIIEQAGGRVADAEGNVEPGRVVPTAARKVTHASA
jgi:bacterioferritin-associated ferredoxin